MENAVLRTFNHLHCMQLGFISGVLTEIHESVEGLSHSRVLKKTIELGVSGFGDRQKAQRWKFHHTCANVKNILKTH